MVLASFLVGLALSVAAIAFCALRGLRLWRQLKTTGGALGTEVAKFEERSARTERVLAESERSNEELQAALERLRRSRAQLSVLTGSLEQAKARMRWLRAFLPA